MEQLSLLKHRHIVLLREVFDSSQKFYMIMELCAGGEVFDRIVSKEHYNEGEAKDTIRQIALALEACHSRGIVHRDLKPENILYATADADVVKLADFGLANVLEKGRAFATACGTPGYVAPEVILNQGYSMEVDMWSLGQGHTRVIVEFERCRRDSIPFPN